MVNATRCTSKSLKATVITPPTSDLRHVADATLAPCLRRAVPAPTEDTLRRSADPCTDVAATLP